MRDVLLWLGLEFLAAVGAIAFLLMGDWGGYVLLLAVCLMAMWGGFRALRGIRQ